MSVSGMLWTHPYILALPVQMYTSCVVHAKETSYLFIVCILCSLPLSTTSLMVCIA